MYGADKVWRQLNREGLDVARCTVERLMKRLGLAGVRRGKVVRTTIPTKQCPVRCNGSIVEFRADRPNQLWVSDFTYVSTWQGWLYVAFVIECYLPGACRLAGEPFHAYRLCARCPGSRPCMPDNQNLSDAWCITVTEDAVCFHPLHRAPRRSRHRTVCRKSGRQLRQRTSGNDQWPLQGGNDLPPCSLENDGGC